MPETITIHPDVMWVAMWVLIWIAMAFGGYKIGFWLARWQQRRAARLQLELERLFPEPWLSVYHECKSSGNYSMRIMYLRAWLTKMVVRDRDLPLLSISASREFAGMVGQSYSDAHFSIAMRELIPYWKFV